MYLSRRALVGLLAVPLIAGGLGGLAAGRASADSPAAAPAPVVSAPAAEPAPTTAPAPAPTGPARTTPGVYTPGVYPFGQRVHLLNGSSIAVSTPVTFQRDPGAAGGEGMPIFVKFKITYTNRTGHMFDPTRTLTAASGGGVEGEPVRQDGLDAPSTKVLPGHSVTWWAGFGVQSRDGLQVELRPGGDIAGPDTYAVVFTDPTTTPPPRPTTHRPKPPRTTHQPAPVYAAPDPQPQPKPKPHPKPKPANDAKCDAVRAAGATTTAVVEFSKIRYDSPGTDDRTNTSLNAEFVRITNNGTVTANLHNWTLRDTAGHVFTFPALLVKPGQRVYVHTGTGTNFKPDTQHLYWGSGNYIWNNTGDTATLTSASGQVDDTCSWGHGGGATACGFTARTGLPANPGLPTVPAQPLQPSTAPTSTAPNPPPTSEPPSSPLPTSEPPTPPSTKPTSIPPTLPPIESADTGLPSLP